MPYLKSLSREVKEMWTLVLSQHHKSLTALTGLDKDLAREIILIEERVNSCEHFITGDCEHYLSLHGPESLNIPYIMFILKTSRQLEIIGDLAKKMANEVLRTEAARPYELLEQINITEPFRAGNKILELLMQAFDEIDTGVAQVVLNRIKICQEMILDSGNSLIDYLKNIPEQLNQGLNLFSVLESIKRTLEVSQNICNGIINYSCASVELQ